MKKYAIAAAVALGAVAVYLTATPKSDVPGSSDGVTGFEAAPPLSAQTVDGKTVSLTDFKGKVVLVDFWATWCDPCKEEIPILVKMNDRLKDKGFVILGVSMDEEGRAAVKKFTAKHPISYPVVLNNGERAPAGWTVPGLPTAYLIGRDGTMRKRWFGEKDPEELEQAVNAALAK
ncbi:MAG: TlpA family protein disulfide reductase [Elusimicrobia bacterium]|nr:TlpA family protein disulfide reductase [Elusimicrobiota bacterium]